MTEQQRAALNAARKAKAKGQPIEAHSAATHAHTEHTNAQLGRKVVSVALTLMGLVTTLAITMCFSSAWVALLVFILGSLVLGLLSCAANLYVQAAVAPETFEAIGVKVGQAIGFFKRTPKLAAA